jgi:hypothetical protein
MVITARQFRLALLERGLSTDQILRTYRDYLMGLQPRSSTKAQRTIIAKEISSSLEKLRLELEYATEFNSEHEKVLLLSPLLGINGTEELQEFFTQASQL